METKMPVKPLLMIIRHDQRTHESVVSDLRELEPEEAEFVLDQLGEARAPSVQIGRFIYTPSWC
jgi:hypothetical protein